jgi:rhodanese-related sulfurtransferase
MTGCGETRRDAAAEEAAAVRLAQQAVQGDYGLIDARSLADLVLSQSDMVLLDVRPREAFRKAHILGATNLPFPAEPMLEEWDPRRMDGLSAEQFATRLSKDPEMRIVVYSEGLDCPRSHTAALWARRLGFTNVHRCPGGLEAWTAAGNETRSIPGD